MNILIYIQSSMRYALNRGANPRNAQGRKKEGALVFNWELNHGLGLMDIDLVGGDAALMKRVRVGVG